MRVKRLQMTSFRGIGDLTLEFHETEPTIFIGINGVGKSSILDCLAILLSLFTGWIEDDTNSVKSFSQEDITNGYNRTHNQITILHNSDKVSWFRSNSHKEDSNQTFIDKTLDNFLSIIIERMPLLKPKSFQGIKKSMPFLKNLARSGGVFQSDFKEIDSVWEEIIGGVEFQKLIDQIRSNLDNNNEFNLPIVVYYPVSREVIDTSLKIPEKNEFKQIDAYHPSLNAIKVDFNSFFEWFRNQEDLENEERLNNNSNYRDRKLEAVRQAISFLLPDFSNLRVRRSPLRMTVKKQDEELIVNQLSDGEKCLLAMVGDLARRLAIANPGLANPLEGSGVVMIDEIELHLHPKWQREIIPALKRTFPNCQFIITTHSPQIISQVKPDSIYILEKTNNGIIAIRPESSYGRDSNRILEDLMDTSERPQEIKARLQELFRLIDDGKLTEAREMKKYLADEIGYSEPEFASADMLIRRKEILAR